MTLLKDLKCICNYFDHHGDLLPKFEYVLHQKVSNTAPYDHSIASTSNKPSHSRNRSRSTKELDKHEKKGSHSIATERCFIN